MNEWPPDLGAQTVIAHIANARLMRTQARVAACRRIGTLLLAAARYAVAPFAFGRRRCSSSRGNISTKLHGR
jgi:hypothetical protein